MKQNFIVVLVLISLKTNGIEQFFVCLLVICISYLEKYLLRSFDCVLIVLCIILLLNSKNSLHILDSIPLSDTEFPNIFSHSKGCLFTSL